MTALVEAAAAALTERDVDAKLAAVAALAGLDPDGGRDRHRPAPVEAVGRPARPVLVSPRSLRARGVGTVAGRVALVHAVAHIELNAVNLALDAVQRFPDLPTAYRVDWARVAAEEARHFGLLRARLHALGSDYGDLPAHDGLWQAAVRTAGDPLVRMALVPRVLEARGLDVTPGMIERLREVGDHETVAALEVILAEEADHVAVGSRWFVHLCRERGVEPGPTFLRLLAEHGVSVRGPLNLDARRAGGFDAAELAALSAGAA